MNGKTRRGEAAKREESPAATASRDDIAIAQRVPQSSDSSSWRKRGSLKYGMKTGSA